MSGVAEIWIFIGEGMAFPSGVFTTRAAAEAWISAHRLTGVLTRYPVDVGVWDWAVESGSFEPKREEHHTPRFIQSFSSAKQEHYHFEDGHR